MMELRMCEKCWKEETPWWKRIAGRKVTVIEILGQSYAGIILGITNKERHQKDFEETGDVIHLERMLRHVE